MLPVPVRRKAVCSGAECKPYPFKSYFPRDTSPVALDLLQQMLVFDAEQRISVENALQHPYLAELHGQVWPRRATSVRPAASQQQRNHAAGCGASFRCVCGTDGGAPLPKSL